MINTYRMQPANFHPDTPKELVLLSIIAQSFFQPFSLEDNLLVILTALTSGAGIGFNRATLFLTEGDKLKATMWLGPRSPEEAEAIWTMLSSPGLGYAEIVEHNRELVSRILPDLQPRLRLLTYNLEDENLKLPALAARNKEIILVSQASSDPAVDRTFLDFVQVDEFLCLPLVARNEVMGEIVVDNGITHAPIKGKDIELASLCALLAGNYIYTTKLYKKVLEMEKMAALGEMAAFISHQLRNPIVAIGGFTRQLLDQPCEREKCNRNLHIIQQEIQHLENIIFRMSHFLKIKIKELVPIDYRPILLSIPDRPDIKAKTRDKRISISLPEDTSLILCDPVYFEEAIVNLLDNALDVTPPGGLVYIRACRSNRKWVTITVKDSGPGLDEKSQTRMFSPFFSTKESGLGLGLLFVRRVLESCGGKIEVRSKPGRGTMFRLYFLARERGQS
ncbi:MAG: ATP-binding protein [Candidatus Saccharicenans sp.]|jgi:signal transduction histidine kinase|nr:ATP-binding protein [Candidatus Saccharicenans sp.]MDH7493737.1 ATP-binding protein [Candidatus Saccharicenans sp.]